MVLSEPLTPNQTSLSKRWSHHVSVSLLQPNVVWLTRGAESATPSRSNLGRRTSGLRLRLRVVPVHSLEASAGGPIRGLTHRRPADSDPIPGSGNGHRRVSRRQAAPQIAFPRCHPRLAYSCIFCRRFLLYSCRWAWAAPFPQPPCVPTTLGAHSRTALR